MATPENVERPQLFRQYHRRQRVQIRTAIFRGIADTEKTELAHALQHLARHHAVLFPLQRVRLDLLLDKTPDLGPEQLMLFFQIDRRHVVAGNLRAHTNSPRLGLYYWSCETALRAIR